MTHTQKHQIRWWQVVSVLAIMLAIAFPGRAAFAGRLTDTSYQPGEVANTRNPAQLRAAHISGLVNPHLATQDTVADKSENTDLNPSGLH